MGPKKTWPERKRNILRFLAAKKRPPRSGTPLLQKPGKVLIAPKRLGPTKAQRQAMREQGILRKSTFQALGGRDAGVTPKSASRYTVSGTTPVYRIESSPGRYVQQQHWPYEQQWVPGEAKKIQVGANLSLKRLHKRGGGGAGGGRGEGPSIKGSAAQKRARKAKGMRLGGTMGGIPSREKRKHKKHKPQAEGT